MSSFLYESGLRSESLVIRATQTVVPITVCAFLSLLAEIRVLTGCVRSFCCTLGGCWWKNDPDRVFSFSWHWTWAIAVMGSLLFLGEILPASPLALAGQLSANLQARLIHADRRRLVVADDVAVITYVFPLCWHSGSWLSGTPVPFQNP